MSTYIDGAPPSMDPGRPEDRPRREQGDDEAADSGSSWLQEEIQRRIAAGRNASGGRHAKRNAISSTTSINYVPRHSTATPGPGAMPPPPIATPARGIPRMPSAWSVPPDSTGSQPVVGPDGHPVVPGPVAADPIAPVPGAGPDASGPLTAGAAAPAVHDRLAPATPPSPAPAHPAPPGAEPDEGHRRAMLAGGTARVPVGDRGAPPPWRSGDPGAAVARRAGEQADAEAGALAAREAEEASSRRVRVVLSERRGMTRPVRTVVDVQEGTGVGELLRSNLIGSQLAVALRFAFATGVLLAGLPALFFLFPEIGKTEVFGLRIPWLLLGVLVYPYLVLMGIWHTRTAERVEQNFADHVQD